MSSWVKSKGDIIRGNPEHSTTSAPMREFFVWSAESGWIVKAGDDFNVMESIVSSVAGDKLGEDSRRNGIKIREVCKGFWMMLSTNYTGPNPVIAEGSDPSSADTYLRPDFQKWVEDILQPTSDHHNFMFG